MSHVALEEYCDILEDASIGFWNIFLKDNDYFFETNYFLNDLLKIKKHEINILDFINLIHKNELEFIKYSLFSFFKSGKSFKNSFLIKIGYDYKKIIFSGKRVSENSFKGFIQVLDENFFNQKNNEIALAEIIHEIRTPINSMIGMINLLSKTNKDINQKEYFTKLEKSSLSLNQFITEVLENSKNEFQSTKSNNNFLNIRKLVEDVYDIIKNDLNINNLIFTYDIDKRIPTNLTGNEISLKQILVNLLSNSIKFTKEGFIKLDIKLKKQKESNFVILFTVKDSGCGIKNDEIKNLFEPFVQSKNSRSLTKKGVGLGLFITKKLIKNMNGSIWCRSNIEKGTSFYFTLQFKEHKKVIKDINVVFNKYSNLPFYSKNKNVLIVDDNEVNLILSKEILKHDGFNVDICENGQDAIKKAKDKKYDFILMDINMPKINGFDAANILKNNYHIDSKIIALSGNDLNTKKNINIDGYLLKPFEPLKLYKLLEEIL